MERRTFLKLGATAAAGLLWPAGLWQPALARPGTERVLSLRNIHTGESLSRAYWARGEYLADGLADFARILRDHRTGEIHPVDPGLLEQLHALTESLESAEPFEIISGYRSSRTNENLRQAGHQAARKSFHLTGRAVDIRLPDVAHADLHRAALGLRAGGVGDYPGRRFVHLDTGPVRTW